MERLLEAARTGNVEELHRLMGETENLQILENVALNPAHENPLHVAIKAGHLGFVQAMLGLKPEFAREQLDQDGFRPLDLASALGHVEIVKELITTSSCTTSRTGDHDVCRLKGRDGRAAIHYAVIKGQIEVMKELLTSSPECVKDVTGLGETTLHLALKYYQFEAFKNLLEWLENHAMLEELVNLADRNDGYTVLHLAVNKRQCEVVELLLGSTSTRAVLDVNAKNSKGLTAMDIMDIMIKENVSSDDVHLKDILHRTGALTAADAATAAAAAPENIVISIDPNSNILQRVGSAVPVADSAATNRISNSEGEPDWLHYFKFKKDKESPSETRNALLVIIVLIITVTYQAGVTPPGHILNAIQVERITQSSNSPKISYSAEPPGPTSYGHDDHYQYKPSIRISRPDALLFYLPNTVGLVASSLIMIWLTNEFPFRFMLYISLISLWATYLVSIIKATDTVSMLLVTLVAVVVFWLPLFTAKMRASASATWRRCWGRSRARC